MSEPIASRPHWPDALSKAPDATTGMKPWSWAHERLEQSHNYWNATSGAAGPHQMIVCGICWD
jgi:hypothetical protein